MPLYAFIGIFAFLLHPSTSSLISTGCTRNTKASLCAYYARCTADTLEQLDYSQVSSLSIKSAVSLPNLFVLKELFSDGTPCNREDFFACYFSRIAYIASYFFYFYARCGYNWCTTETSPAL